jgi:hypothetical protein
LSKKRALSKLRASTIKLNFDQASTDDIYTWKRSKNDICLRGIFIDRYPRWLLYLGNYVNNPSFLISYQKIYW